MEKVAIWCWMFCWISVTIVTSARKYTSITPRNGKQYFDIKIKSPKPLRAALDRQCFLITDKHTEILDCIPCDKWTDATKRIISPCFAVNNEF